MKKVLILLLFSLFLLSSCKKDNSNPSIAGTVPSAPTLLSPNNVATDVAVVPTLSWNSSSGAAGYTLQVSVISSFTSFTYNQSGISGTNQQVAMLSPLKTYYWRVCATNSYGTSDWSPVRSFTTTGLPPGAPVLFSPTNKFNRTTTAT